jgi:hypothetical protein
MSYPVRGRKNQPAHRKRLQDKEIQCALCFFSKKQNQFPQKKNEKDKG